MNRRSAIRVMGAGLVLATVGGLEEIALATTRRDFQVDLSRTFVPEFIAQSRNAHKYFLEKPKKVKESKWRRRLESLGLFYDFDYFNLELYDSLSSKQFEQIETERIIKKGYTSEKTLRSLDRLKGKVTLTEKEKSKKKKLERKIRNVRTIQEKLTEEGFFKKDVNGIFSHSLRRALRRYQRAHRLSIDGQVNKKTLRELNTSYQQQAQEEVDDYKDFFGDRLFHQTYVLDKVNLSRLVNSSFAQLGIASPSDCLAFIQSNPQKVNVSLDIPENYLVKKMDLEAEITRRRQKHRGYLHFYQHYKSQKILLLKTKMALGGKHGVRKFPTPSGVFCWKRAVVMTTWKPPGWAGEKKNDPATKPGPLNAFGMYMAEYYKKTKAIGYKFRYFGDDVGIRVHSTNSPNSVTYGWPSHGCTRVHPKRANRLFPFMIKYNSDQKMVENRQRGSIILFNKPIKATIHK